MAKKAKANKSAARRPKAKRPPFNVRAEAAYGIAAWTLSKAMLAFLIGRRRITAAEAAEIIEGARDAVLSALPNARLAEMILSRALADVQSMDATKH